LSGFDSVFVLLSVILESVLVSVIVLEEISVSEVQGVESNALRKLRHPKISRELRAYIQEESMPEQGLTHEDYKET